MTNRMEVKGMEQKRAMKKVGDSRTEQVYVIRSQHINPQGRLFGGYLMQWIDDWPGSSAGAIPGKW